MKVYGRVCKRERERAVSSSLNNLYGKLNNKERFIFKNEKEFLIDELFEVSRGKRIVRNRDYVETKDNKNIYPVITPTLSNCGIDGWYYEYNCKGNCIVVGGDVSGMLGNYQENKCWVVDTSRIIYPKSTKCNKYNLMFVLSQLQKYNYIYSYSKKANPDDIKKLILKLPVDSQGNPDWKFMEEYVRERESWSQDLVLWEQIPINSFNLYSSKNSLDKNKIINGENRPYNYITRTDINNGIHSKIAKQKVELNEGNCLTIGLDTQTVFYQNEPFYTGQNIHILRIENANKYVYLFIASILKKKIKEMYSWGGNGATLGRLKQQELLLPIKPNGELDLEYIEQFIKSLSSSKYL